jgi:CMP-N,N'-diacetyllegionaminic acid synthase
MKILIIIPAKLDSKRLSRKNLREINNKSLLEYSIDYAKASKYKKHIIVSSESSEVKDICDFEKIDFHHRDKSLCGDAEVVDVYFNIMDSISDKYDLVVALQPDHPDREHTLDYCIDYMVSNNYDDLITIESNYKRSGSVRIFKYEHLIKNNVSKRIGCLKDNATDIHYEEDLNNATKKINNGK